ncbi:MAG: putative DNA binding domain-containing protein [Candidatus Methanoplasma sp.]|jgi:ATP-dependent DNA helicase RecG|nr:putative DNA binding domain-containing protein [Candidatus Methanoplasma sp.]
MDEIPDRETISVEFKSDAKKLDDSEIIDAAVGLANADGGAIYLGVEDDGEATGVHASHSDIRTLAAFIANHTVPPLSVSADKIAAGGRDVVVIRVPKSNAIVSTAGGKVLRRRIKADGAPETVPMYPHEYGTRLSSLSLLDFSAQTVMESSLDDLDPLERQRLRGIIRKNRGEAALLDLVDEDLDKALGIVRIVGDRYVPTVAGLLLIGREESIARHVPTAGLDLQALKNTEVKVNDTVSTPLLAAFESATAFISAWNSDDEIERGIYRVSVPKFDGRAFREGLANALSHRDYSVMRRVRVLIDGEGLTISSPGGFVEGVSLENLLTAEPRSRNPALADAFKRIGLAERTGRGVDRIFEGSLSYGKPEPSYSGSDPTTVSLFIPSAKPDEAFSKLVSEIVGEGSDRISVFSLIALHAIRAKGPLDLAAEGGGMTERRVRAAADHLVDLGYADMRAKGCRRTYAFSAKAASMLERGAPKRRGHAGRDAAGAVLELADSRGGITRGDVMSLLGVGAPRAYGLLSEMVGEGLLEMSGKNKGATYRRKNS